MRALKARGVSAGAALVLLFAAAAGGEELTADKVAGVAAARADAFLNLTDLVYGTAVMGGRTVKEMLGGDVRLREQTEAALRGAHLAAAPAFDDSGLVHVVVELNTMTLPYDLRLKFRTLPQAFRVDGFADKGMAVQAEPDELGAVAEEVKQWAKTDLEAEGKAEVAAAGPREQAKENARRGAIADAYAALAKKVEALDLDAGVPIRDFIAQHEELRPKVNAALLGARLVSESLDRAGTTYSVKVSLRPMALLKPLRHGPFRAFRSKVLAPEQVELARRNARADAVATLKQRIYALRLTSGIEAAELIKNRPQMQAEIEQLCRLTPIEQVRVTEDGVVKVYVSVLVQALPRELRDLLLSGTNPQILAIGGGLPVQLRKTEPEKKPDDKPPAEPPKPPPAEPPKAPPAKG